MNSTPILLHYIQVYIEYLYIIIAHFNTVSLELSSNWSTPVMLWLEILLVTVLISDNTVNLNWRSCLWEWRPTLNSSVTAAGSFLNSRGPMKYMCFQHLPPFTYMYTVNSPTGLSSGSIATYSNSFNTAISWESTENSPDSVTMNWPSKRPSFGLCNQDNHELLKRSQWQCTVYTTGMHTCTFVVYKHSNSTQYLKAEVIIYIIISLSLMIIWVSMVCIFTWTLNTLPQWNVQCCMTYTRVLCVLWYSKNSLGLWNLNSQQRPDMALVSCLQSTARVIMFQ